MGCMKSVAKPFFYRADGEFREVFRGVAWWHPGIANFLSMSLFSNMFHHVLCINEKTFA